MAGLTRATPFEAAFSASEIDDLRQRLARTRWPDQPEGYGWQIGTERGFLEGFCRYWAQDFDWAASLVRLNRWPQYRDEIARCRLHYYHIRSPRPDAVPLLLAHGWPGGSAEFLDVVPLLTEPSAPGIAFHLVIPTMPGFGFSGPVSWPGCRARDIAGCYTELMALLGYGEFFVHGGDKGTRLAMEMAALAPDRVRGLHLGLMPAAPPDPENPREGLSASDAALLDRNDRFSREEAAYQALQRTKPQSLAYGLNDSPAGVAAWLVEKYRAWTDCDGDLNAAMPRDRMLDLISIYWFTGTIGSSMRSYYEEAGPGRQTPLPPVKVPVGHTVFPAEIMHTPRVWAERSFDIAYWSEVGKGGHFPALEVPDMFAAELRRCFSAMSGH